MRFAAWALIGVFVAGAAFLAYLTWAFTPRQVTNGPDPAAPRVLAQGTAGEGLFYQIVEWRDKSDAVYDVYLSELEKPPPDQRGVLALRTVEWPVPLRVRRIDNKTVEVAVDRPPAVRITINPLPKSMVYLERGIAIEP
ncbi:MAG: hypothetical protein FJW32_01080 [Acidobacteria bacterium]|nr:hypothetical protein [Acidobacteriota bacterium]